MVYMTAFAKTATLCKYSTGPKRCQGHKVGTSQKAHLDVMQYLS